MKSVYVVSQNDMIVAIYDSHPAAMERMDRIQAEAGGTWSSHSRPERRWQSDGPIARLECEVWPVQTYRSNREGPVVIKSSGVLTGNVDDYIDRMTPGQRSLLERSREVRVTGTLIEFLITHGWISATLRDPEKIDAT